MPTLSTSQLRAAAKDFRETAAGDSLTDKITASQAELSSHCREAQNALRSSMESADSAIVIGTMVNRLFKISERKEVRGTWATAAQDSLRASVLFAGAGLDTALKRLAEDTLPLLVQFDDEVSAKLQAFSERAISEGESVSAKQLVALLLGSGDSPRDVMVRRWSDVLQGASAQSAERVDEMSAALGVTNKELRMRARPTSGKDSPLEQAFTARNEIAHELDVTKPSEAVRQRLEKIRRQRSAGAVRAHVIEMLDVTQCIINDVAVRLEANGHA